MELDKIRNFTQANKASWNASAHLHSEGEGWNELLCKVSKPNFNILDKCLTNTFCNHKFI